ncbi:MAG: hypothetical protein KC731_38845 [Myxococcales bacterium]|nr:hypothetical protein [Myxococcales bacterium]
MTPRSMFPLMGLALVAIGCSPSPSGVGVTGTPRYRSEEPMPAKDFTTLTVNKGRMSSRYEIVASDNCGGDCNYRRRGTSSLVLEIGPNGRASATNDGSQLEEFHSVGGNAEHLLEWDRRWTGSWVEGRGGLVVDLQPESTDCTRTSKSGAKETLCQGGARLQLVCVPERVPLYRPKHQVTKAWVCRPHGKADEQAITPFPWVFGVSEAVDVSDRWRGMSRDRYYMTELPKDRSGAKRRRRRPDDEPEKPTSDDDASPDGPKG